MKKLVIEFSNERLITPSGLSLVGQMLGKSNFIKKCNNKFSLLHLSQILFLWILM